MKKNKKFLILFTFMILLISIAVIPSAFASDNSTDEIYKVDESFDNLTLDSGENIISDENNGTIYVSNEGNDNNTGESDKPVQTIAKSIELASKENSTVHKIIIREGNYTEYNLNITSELEISSEGNVIIDANKKNLIFSIDTQKEVKISGITFKNGWGGAIYITDAKVTIDNCIFVNNTSDYGGAIYWNADDGSLLNSYFTQNRARIGSAVLWGSNNEENEIKGKNGLIKNVTFENNDNANTAAGCMGLAIYSDNVHVLDSIFINNIGKYQSTGGSLYLYGDNILVENCLFENNTMSQAPAIQSEGNNATIKKCRFVNNKINATALDTARAGAIEIQSRNANIYENTFIYNGGDECYNGGAIAVIYSDPLRNGLINITKNIFINNTAVYGGCIFLDGGYESYCEMEGIIDNNLFESSDASTAAGVYLRYVNIETSTINCTNNLFKNLIATSTSSIFIDYASVRLFNNTITDCTSLDGNNHIFNNEGYITGNLTVTVNKNDTIELYAGKYVDVNATVVDDMNNSISGGIIRFIVESKDVDEDGFSLESGTATVRFYSTQVGIYTIEADYTNGDRGFIKTSMIIALPYDINITFTNKTGFSTENISIPIQVSVNGFLVDDENVTITFNNETFNLTVFEGAGLINLTLPEINGTYILSVTYDIKTVSNTILVKNNSVILTVPEIRVTPNSGYLNISLYDVYNTPLAKENITININGNESVEMTDDNGIISIPLNLGVGNYTVYVNYAGNKYKSASATSTICVAYIDVILTSSDVTMNYGDKKSYIVRLTDNNHTPLANQEISLTINKKTTTVLTDSNGIATLLLDLNPDKYTISAEYAGNSVYNPKTIKNKITIKSKAKLTGQNINMYFSETKYYKVRLFGDDGKAVGSGKTIKINVNGKTHNVKTNKNGYVLFKISLKPKTYTVKATYSNLKVTNKIVVKKVLFTKNISKKKAKKIKFQAKLAKGKKTIYNKKIKFKFKGKIYSAKTNKKGIATVGLKNLKAGKYIIYTYYSTLKIKNVIKIKK